MKNAMNVKRVYKINVQYKYFTFETGWIKPMLKIKLDCYHYTCLVLVLFSFVFIN